ncbi:MAG: metal ABC transporter permease [bacterium]
MIDALPFLAWPFAACLVLTGIHAYLGLHVVERQVIFVDLSLAQIAALGTTIAFLAGHDLHGQTAYFFSLGFTLLGALIFALSRGTSRRVPQEAVIGIVYAVCAAVSILIVDRSPEGTEHLKYILVGNLLAVSPQEVAKMAVLYGVVGWLHWIWRRPFLAISTNPAGDEARRLRVRLWDFLFYATFGLVVTSSVAIAGVLLVFSFLIVPAVTAMLLARGVGARLAIGWAMGLVVSVLGIFLSYALDMPTGASVIATFGVVLALVAVGRAIVMRRAT